MSRRSGSGAGVDAVRDAIRELLLGRAANFLVICGHHIAGALQFGPASIVSGSITCRLVCIFGSLFVCFGHAQTVMNGACACRSSLMVHGHHVVRAIQRDDIEADAASRWWVEPDGASAQQRQKVPQRGRPGRHLRLATQHVSTEDNSVFRRQRRRCPVMPSPG